MTKGDNNDIDDRALYPKGQSYVYRDQVVGLVRGYLPVLGWVAILLNEYQYVKFGVIMILALAAFMTR